MPDHPPPVAQLVEHADLRAFQRALEDIFRALDRISTTSLSSRLTVTGHKLDAVETLLHPITELAKGTTAAMTYAKETERMQWMASMRAASEGIDDWTAYKLNEKDAFMQGFTFFLGVFLGAVGVVAFLHWYGGEQKRR